MKTIVYKGELLMTSKNFSFSRFMILTKALDGSNFHPHSEQEKKHVVKLHGIKREDYVLKLFGVTDFYFIPKQKGNLYYKNMIETLTYHSLYLLGQCSTELNKELFSWMSYYLFGLQKILLTQGWRENALLVKEASVLNEFFNNDDRNFNFSGFLNTPLIQKHLDIYYSEDDSSFISDTAVNNTEFQSYEQLVLFHGVHFTKVEVLECSINALYSFIDALKPKKSFQSKNINYHIGETDDHIHEEIIFLTRNLAMQFHYLINCRSWKDNYLHGFDEIELIHRKRFRLSEEYCRYYEENRTEDTLVF